MVDFYPFWGPNPGRRKSAGHCLKTFGFFICLLLSGHIQAIALPISHAASGVSHGTDIPLPESEEREKVYARMSSAVKTTVDPSISTEIDIASHQESDPIQNCVSITTQPQGQQVCEGSTARFSVVASGPITGYKWYRNGVVIAGATSASYEFTTSYQNRGDNFKVEVMAACGNVSSNVVTLNVNKIPVFTIHPSNNMRCGGSVAFSSLATEISSYQWMKDGADLTDQAGKYSGTKTNTLFVTNLTSADAGFYSMKVFGSGGCAQTSVVSNPGELVMNEPITISTQPKAQQVCAGETASLSVEASGTITGYQWYRNGTAITGATNPTYEFATTAQTTTSTYFVQIKGPCGGGSVNSSYITVSVNPPPTITASPQSGTRCAGQSISFNVTASNAGSYQWMKDGVDLTDQAGRVTGSQTNSLLIQNLCSTCDAGSYTVKVFGNGGCASQSVVSGPAQLTVNEPVVISAQPADQQVCEGSQATFTVVATGTITGYQWYRNSTAIAGATSASYQLAAATANHGDKFKVEVKGPCGNPTSTEVTLSVNSLPVVTAQPQGATRCAGQEYTFNITASNAGGYQWMKNGTDLADEAGRIAGSQTSSLKITNLCATCDPGSYTVEVFGNGGCSSQSVVSSPAQLTVNEPVVISTQPTARQVCEGAGASFTVAASGTVTGYQWYRNGAAIAGATGATYQLTAAAGNSGDKFKVEALGPCGNVTSAEVALTVDLLPVVTVQPLGATKCAGQEYTFGVTATNAGGYQWMRNGADLADEAGRIAGSQTASLKISNLCPSCDAGSYTVKITGSGTCAQQGTVSSAAQLTVNEPVVISTQPSVSQVCEGSPAQFSVTAGGTITGYQWYRNGAAIAGATGATYQLTAAAANHGDKFKVEVLGPCGNLTSNEVTLSVNSLPVVTAQPQGATRCAGQEYTFNITASNAGGYQWMKNGTDLADEAGRIAGSQTASLKITNLCATCDPGSYTVEVFGNGGCSSQSVVSSPAQLNVNEPVVISTQPTARQVCEGAGASFTVAASGTLTGYQWYRNGTAIAGATGPTYQLTAAASNNGDKFKVEVLGPCGNVTSSEVALTVDLLPVVTVQPLGATKCAGQEYTFGVTAANAGGYQWMKNGADLADETGRIAGSQTASLKISNLCSTCDAGSYTVKITGSGTCAQQGTVSSAAQLTVNEPVVINSQPSASQVCEGAGASFTVAASGTVTGYQWYRNGTAIAGATGTTYQLTAAAGNSGDKFKVEVLGPCGNVTSSEVALTVDLLPVVTVQLLGATKCAGQEYTFNVTAANAGGYQWMRNGADLADEAGRIAGSQTASLKISNLCPSCDAGSYTVKITGSGTCAQQGTVSSAAQLTVNEPVVINSQPLASQVCEGAGASFTVAASGTLTGYQWYRNGAAIAGATGATYQLTAAAGNSGDKYKVEVLGPCGNVTSAEVALIVISVAPPTIATNKPDGLCTGEQALLTSTGCVGTVNWFVDGQLVATGETFTTQRPGVYTATCTSQGCTSITTSNPIAVVQHGPLEYASSLKDISCFGYQDGAITLFPSGSTGAPYTVVWTNRNGATGTTADGLAEGTYQFTIKDRIGCSLSGSQAVKQPSKPNASLQARDISCFGKQDGTVVLTARSDFGNFTYRINNGTPVSFPGESVTLNTLGKGTYSISIADGKNCEVLAPASVVINEPTAVVTQVVAAINPRSYQSKDGSVEVGVTGGILPYSVRWSDAAGTDITSQSKTTENPNDITSRLFPVDGGTYKVAVKDRNGCEQVREATLITPKRIEIAARVDSISCFGQKDGKISVTVTGGVAYPGQTPYKTQWLRQAGTGTKDTLTSTGFALNNLAPGLYEVVVSDANLISETALVRLTEPALLTSKVNKVVPNYCLSQPLGEATLIIAGGRAPYTTTWNGTSVSTSTFSKLPTGTHTLTVADASGCQTTSQVIIADSSSAYSVGASYTLPTCYGRCDAILTSEVKGGTAPYQYAWAGYSGASSRLTGICGTGQTELTITDSKGCVLKSKPVALTSPDPRPLNLEKELEVCPTQPFSLNASSATWGKSFTWAYPNGTLKQGATVQADSLGVYEVTILDEKSCGGKQQITVKPFAYVKQLFTVSSQAEVNKPIVCVDLTNPVPSSIRWQYTGGELVKQDAFSIKLRFPRVGTYQIKELVTVDNCEYPLTKTIEIKESVNTGGFPLPVGMAPFQVEVMGNPIRNNRLNLAIDNEANEDFTVTVYSSSGDRVLLQKSFTNHGSNPVSLDLADRQMIEGIYILNVVTPTTKIAKTLLISR